MQADGQNARRGAQADDAHQYQPEHQCVNRAHPVQNALGQPGQGPGGGQVACGQQRQGQRQQRAQQRTQRGDANRGPGRLCQASQVMALHVLAVLRAQQRAVVAAVLQRRVAQPDIQKAGVGKISGGFQEVGEWVAAHRQLTLMQERPQAQGHQQGVGQCEQAQAVTSGGCHLAVSIPVASPASRIGL